MLHFCRVVSVLAVLICFVPSLLCAVPVAPAVKPDQVPPDAPERVAMAKLQVFLDSAGFRPGKIDGLGGEFTQRAADRYCDAHGLPRGSVIDVSSLATPYREHEVTAADARWVGPTASKPAQQEKLKELLYGTLWEAVAERFHCDQKFLMDLNPTITEPAVASVLRVPDVKEFLLADVKALQKERAALAKATPTPSPTPLPPPAPDLLSPAPFDLSKPIAPRLAPLLTTPKPLPTPSPAPTPNPTPEPVRNLVLLRNERLIEVYEDGHILACFPCTPGSAKIPVAPGMWKITSNILMPNFRWDKSVLETGVRSDAAFLLPPGPNSPVGIVWMGINRPSIGIHGTNSPDRIGRNESSGCIRLANWDAWMLCQLVKKGTAVEVR